MKILGERISILKTEKLLSIVILATNNKKKLALLFFWLLAWSVCGLIVFINYFQIENKEARLFLIVYLSFWAYFEVSIIRAFIWRKFGKEKLWIKEGKLYYQREVNGRGKIREYQTELISDVKLLEVRPTSFIDNLNQSFWVRGGERLEISHQAQTLRFAMQVSEEEAKNILKEIKSRIS